MRSGDIVLILPSCPIITNYGVNFAYVVGVKDDVARICLCTQLKTELDVSVNQLVCITYDQVPEGLKVYLPVQPSMLDVVNRLDRIERKITQIGVKIGMTPLANDEYAK